MIEINLLEKKKAFKAPVVLGVDTAKLPWRMIVVASLLAKFPVDYYREYTLELEAAKQNEVKALNTELSKLRVELRKNKGIKEQLEAFNKQIERLKERSAQVDKIIKLKTNPKHLLEKMARSAPEDLWFNELILDGNDKITIKGGADSYTSIGEFILNVNDSPIFGGSLQLKDSKTEEETKDGISFREENFVIEGEVKLYDPF